jgi:hypothetical protein
VRCPFVLDPLSTRRIPVQKLSLDLDSLSVQSFPTHAASPGRGTVHGNAAIWESPSLQFTFCNTHCSCPDTR